MKFRKALAVYYLKWYRDTHDSAVYCKNKGEIETSKKYLMDANRYFNLINENWDAIEFFSVGDNAFLIDSALPERFRGYE